MDASAPPMAPTEPYVLVARAPVNSPKRIWRTKLALRVVSAVVCIIIFGIAGHLATTWAAEPILAVSPAAGVAVVFDVAEFVCLLARRGHRGMHPGVCVAVDLLLWMAFAGAAVFTGLFQYLFYYAFYDYYYGDPEISDLDLSTACMVFAILNTIVHFVIFVIACHETRMRNKSTQVYYAPVMVQCGMPPAQYMMPVQAFATSYYPPQMQYKQEGSYSQDQSQVAQTT